MGTNYYVEPDPPCPHCGRPHKSLHIGKSSMGWEFLFAPYPELGLISWEAWKSYLSNRRIVDEYGISETLSALEALIMSKRGGWNSRTAPDYAWGNSTRDRETSDAEGFRFCDTADFS